MEQQDDDPLPERIAWFAPWRWFAHWKPWKRWGMLAVMILGTYIELPVMLNILIHYRPTTPLSDRLSWYYEQSIGAPIMYASAHSSIVRAFYAPQFALTEWIGRNLSPMKSRGRRSDR